MINRTRNAFINLSNFSAVFTPSTSRKGFQRVAGKKKPFIVINTDISGYFAKALLGEAKDLGLEEQDKLFRQKSASAIKYGEFIIFGDAAAFSDYDYRVEPYKESLLNFDARKWKAYDLVDEFSTVRSKLRAYAKANKARSYNPTLNVVGVKITEVSSQPQTCCRACPIAEEILNVNSFNPGIIYKKDYARIKNMIPYPSVTGVKVEDVKVHYSWVKIGYNQYDIQFNPITGEEFIVRENGDTFRIREDRFGHRYLST